MTKVVYVGLDVHKDSIVIAVAREGWLLATTRDCPPAGLVRPLSGVCGMGGRVLCRVVAGTHPDMVGPVKG